MNNFLKRTLTASVFVAVLLGCTYYNQLSFSILFFCITILGLREFYSLSSKEGCTPQKIWGIVAGATLFITNALVSMGYCSHRILVIPIPMIFLTFIFELYTKSINPFRNIAFTILGVVYVGVPFSLLNYLVTYTGSYNHELLVGLFFILWSGDSGAYLVGSAIGKRKLFPRVSPGKTWEGFIGGSIASYVVVFFVSKYYVSIGVIDWMLLATLIILIGTLGDLVKSLFKRSVNVKDSGNLLPGHGGIIDRFDSLLMSVPFVFTYLCLRGYF